MVHSLKAGTLMFVYQNILKISKIISMLKLGITEQLIDFFDQVSLLIFDA